MDGNVVRVQPVVGNLTGVERTNWQGKKNEQPPFHLDEKDAEKEGEEKEKKPEGSPSPMAEGEAPVAPPAEGEAGSHLDIVG